MHVAYTATGNTTNVAGHLHRHHKEIDGAEKRTLLTQPTPHLELNFHNIMPAKAITSRHIVEL